MVYTTCMVYGCKSTSYKNLELRFFKLPSSEERRSLWIQACKREDLIGKSETTLKNKRVCSLHFEKYMYSKKNLKMTATPTLCLPANRMYSMETQTPASIPVVMQNYLLNQSVQMISETNIKCEPTEDLPSTSFSNFSCQTTAIQNNLQSQGVQMISETNIKCEPTEDLPSTSFSNFSCQTTAIQNNLQSQDVQMISETNIKCELTEDLPSTSFSNFSCQTTAPVQNNLQSQGVKMTSGTNNLLQIKEEGPSTSFSDYSCQTTAATQNNFRSQGLLIPRETNFNWVPVKEERPSTSMSNYSSQHSTKSLRKVERNNETITRQQFLKGSAKFLNPQMCAIVKTQVNLKQKFLRNRYTNDFKLFCLDLYQSSPCAYRFLSKPLLLPSRKSLSETYIPISTKLDQQVLNILSASIKHKSDVEKECVLCMDEMSLKHSMSYSTKQERIVGLQEIDGKQDPCAAGYAFTVMLRGIASIWKQPIGFSFISVSNITIELKNWITRTIKQLFDIGFRIRGVVSGLGSDFLMFSKKNGIPKDMSYFDVGGRKVYYIYDVLHLFKCVRNDLMKYDFSFNGKTASWDDIETLYHLDKKKDIRLVPRLTEAHIWPNSFQKPKIRFATQVFSNSVVTALKTYTKSQEMKPCDGTIEFIQLMNDVFDLLNSNDLDSEKPYKGGDLQMQLLNKVGETLHYLKIIDKRSGEDVREMVTFAEPFIITIHSIIQLFKDLKNDSFQYLLTRRMNKEPLEHFFGSIRQVGHCREPTCTQFTRAFRKMFMFQLIKLSEHNNCAEDFDKIIANYNNFCKTKSLFVVNKRKNR